MSSLPFHFLVLLEPLGLLYGSSGRLLSPEALTGRAAEHFPPDSPVVAGLLAAMLAHEKRQEEVWDLHTAGPFWMASDHELMLPAPLLLIQEAAGSTGRQSSHHLFWADTSSERPKGWQSSHLHMDQHKAPSGGWIRLNDWPCSDLKQKGAVKPIPIHADPWEPVPHLHPQLREDERVSAGDNALFLEYGIALQPGARLAYLSSLAVSDGLVRFGGEGHLSQLRCIALERAAPRLVQLLQKQLKPPFALITPGVWGGPKLSIREPIDTSVPRGAFPWHRDGSPPGILTERPRPWRHRLGHGCNEGIRSDPGRVGKRRLSRGRWAVPAGSCYQIHDNDPIPPWAEWPLQWFPKEGFSFKHLGTALSLPISFP